MAVNLREKCSSGPRDPGTNPGPGEDLSLKLTTQDLPDGLSQNLIFCEYVNICVCYVKVTVSFGVENIHLQTYVKVM